MRITRTLVFIVLLLCSATVVLAGGPRYVSWMAKVPANARSNPNPYAADPNALLAGAKLFEQHCAQCHGANAEGRKGPNLHSDLIRQATPGEIEWLIKNGVLRRGMPSWSRLPQQQRWQIVTYLKSLK